MKYAILSMDVEDWYHLDYLDRSRCNQTISLLDGLDTYSEFLSSQNLVSSFFVLGEISANVQPVLRKLAGAGHDIASHGWNHSRPLRLSTSEFVQDLRRAKITLEDDLGVSVKGYRAPCFSLDRIRLDLVRENGFGYDSSYIAFNMHPLYGALDLGGFQRLSTGILRQEDFFEFQVSTQALAGKQIPVSGGGYIRMLPWWLMRNLTLRYLRENELYVLYIHPFELSRHSSPLGWLEASLANQIRFRLGRSAVLARLEELVTCLRANEFTFTTFAALRDVMLHVPLGAALVFYVADIEYKFVQFHWTH